MYRDHLGRTYDNFVPLGARIVAYVPDALDRQNASDMAKRINATPSRPLIEACPDMFDDRQGHRTKLRIVSWREE